MNIAFIVGHTFERQGAVATKPINETEYIFNRRFVTYLAEFCQQLIETPKIYFRDGLTIWECHEKIGKTNPDYAIELHFNSYTHPSVRGTETLSSPENIEFGHAIQTAMCQALGRFNGTNRGLKFPKQGERGFLSVSSLKCPSCLIEPFFGSNQSDCELMKERQESLALHLVKAIKDFDDKKRGL